MFFYFKHDVSETGFGLSIQVEPNQLRLIDRASPETETSNYLLGPTEYVPHRDKIQSQKRRVLSTRQDDGYAQNCYSYINIPSSQIYR
jgi:hypothetical protein